MPSALPCVVEGRLSESEVLELDMLLADPGQWPKAIFEGWHVPRGSLPAAMRSWGAVSVGLAFMAAHGHSDVSKRQMQSHYERHVPILPSSPDDIVAKGVAAEHLPPSAGRAVIPTTPATYIDMYQKGLAVGSRALDLLMERVERIVEAGDLPPTDLLLALGKLGTQLATSQAGIVSRGFDLARQKEEELAGFREGSAPEPSLRFGDHRIRVIEGEARPVVDRGHGDRLEYNERARQEGSPTLPA